MPNHIKNRLRLSGDQTAIDSLVEEFSTFYPSEPNKSHDGNLIHLTKDGSVGWLHEGTGVFTRREMDSVVGVPDGYFQDMTEEFSRFPDFAKVIPTPNNDAYNDIPDQETVRNDPDNWYNWNVKHWGTKWNSYANKKLADNTYSFETAWNGIPDLIKVIADKYPSVKIEYDYADEDTGYNVGKHIFEKGEHIIYKIENGSLKAYELAIELRPDILEYMELKDGKYVYKEEE